MKAYLTDRQWSAIISVMNNIEDSSNALAICELEDSAKNLSRKIPKNTPMTNKDKKTIAWAEKEYRAVIRRLERVEDRINAVYCRLEKKIGRVE